MAHSLLFIGIAFAYACEMRENKHEHYKRDAMKHIRNLRISRGVLVLLVAAACFAAPRAVAVCTNPDQQSCSTGYGVSETFFGTGGELEACGTAYCAKQSAGELTVGNTKSNSFQAQTGFNSDRTPWIGVSIVGSPDVDLGVLSDQSTKTGSVQFKVSAYLSDGYVVQIVGPAPTAEGGHVLSSMSSAASTTGIEQFGMNIVANTSPLVGSDPAQDPDYPSQPFGFGQAKASSGYDVANTFTYNSGDTIAESTQSSSYTVYTISYLANISGVTPAGTYTTQQSIVATATF